MRLRNVKNKEEILRQASFLIRDPFSYKGKWSELFHNHHPIYLEIGMGKGKFLVENAKKYPNINFIGIEKYDSVMAKAVQRVEEELPNLFMIRADASMITDIFDHEIDHIYLNFSDPWPKARHHLRRLSSRTFLAKYEEIFQGEKVIEMRTDNLDLFQYSLVSFSQGGYILEDLSFDFHGDREVPITTEYEDKFVGKGMPIYYVLCQKHGVKL